MGYMEGNERKKFRGKQSSLAQLLENVKFLPFWWFKANVAVFHYSFHNWCQNPFLCAGIWLILLLVIKLCVF